MSKNAAILFTGGVAAAVIFFSCAGGPRTGRSETPPETAAPLDTQLPKAGGLDKAAFRGIPPEAKAYLERLERAFGSGDRAFLLAQGEAQFEAEMRPGRDDEMYLALLYRSGEYAADRPRVTGGKPVRLDPGHVSGIEYLSWEAAGPLLAIQARLTGKDGAATPCLLMLVWRLREPKIEGLFL
ncbi:MAG: hypothetical protein LBD48_08335 [Treponema sp.]|jgi:hypothetical protein|nr:hypothetical protein [Treponema sp.]